MFYNSRVFCLVFLILVSFCAKTNVVVAQDVTNVKGIIDTLSHYAAIYNSNALDYEASLYVKGYLNIKKSNSLLKLIPYFKSVGRGRNEYFAELAGSVTFTNPNIYNQKLVAVSTNSNYLKRHVESLVLPHTHANVYSPYIYSNIYSPIAKKSYKYYKFNLDSLWAEDGTVYYKISFKPRINNDKLVVGYLIACSYNWSIRELFIRGRNEIISFSNCIKMGQRGHKYEFMPVCYTLNVVSRLLGNRIEGTYSSYLKYNSLKKPHISKSGDISKYDLSVLYNTKVSDSVVSAIGFDNFVRPVPLSEREEALVCREDSLKNIVTIRKRSGISKVGLYLTKNYSLDFKEHGNLKLYSLISPILFNYSSSNGISYAQKLKYNKFFKGDRLLYFEPKIGYNFKYKELYWNVKATYGYSPANMGEFFLDFGHGYKIKTDRIRYALFKLPIGVYDESKINLTDFRASFFKLGHRSEISNGVTVSAALALYRYSEFNKSDLSKPLLGYDVMVKNIAKNNYNNFVPELSITYTPAQYYYKNGERKAYLYSRYPTFQLNVAHSFSGVFNSTTIYDRVEFDMHHIINISPLHKLCYRFGAGGFFNYTDLYFADFVNFKRNNLPEGWDDEIGGVFQLLTSFKYNEIDKYLRGHIKYDAPFLLVPTILRHARIVAKERLYCNMLLVDTMNPYIELGYGIGTNFFNIGVFWGGEVTKWDMFGFKLTFEVFNK